MSTNFIPYDRSDFFFTQAPYEINCDTNNKCTGEYLDGAIDISGVIYLRDKFELNTTIGKTITGEVRDSAGNIITVTEDDKNILTDTCNNFDECNDLYKKQNFYNKILYNVLTGIQINGENSFVQYDDLVDKYNRDVFGIYTNIIGISIILAIIYIL